jgi:hypothetical protein
MARIKTSKGEATLRPMLAKDERLIGEFADLDGSKDWKAYYRLKSRMVDALDAAIIEVEWDGDFGDLPADEIQVAIIMWDNATEEQALPPENGTSSETPSPAGD